MLEGREIYNRRIDSIAAAIRHHSSLQQNNKKMLACRDRRALCCMSAALIISTCILGSESVMAFAPAPTSVSAKQRIQNSMLFESSPNSGEMVLARDGERLLNVAFSALDDRDKYETVLTGLCAKVIDGGAANSKNGLVDPIRLMEESNSNGITIGPRGIISLVDVSVNMLLWIVAAVCFIDLKSHGFEYLFVPIGIGYCVDIRCACYGKDTFASNK